MTARMSIMNEDWTRGGYRSVNTEDWQETMVCHIRIPASATKPASRCSKPLHYDLAMC